MNASALIPPDPGTGLLIAGVLAERLLMEYLLFGLVFVGLAGAVFFWALVIRKPRRRRKRHRRSRSTRNPTLAETRGLPPLRDDRRPDHSDYSS
jgi:hypothetical protein